MSKRFHELRWTQTLAVNRWGSIRVDWTAVCSCGRYTSKPRLGKVAAQRAWESHEKAKQSRRERSGVRNDEGRRGRRVDGVALDDNCVTGVGQGVGAVVTAHRIDYEEETERRVLMHRAVCTPECGYASRKWADKGRAMVSGVAHLYAVTIIPAEKPVKASQIHVDALIPRAYGRCYLHEDSSPCGCLRGCTGCTGCHCSCDCVTE